MKGRKNSGISPVVATVVLVAVAIVIAIAVAFWASGLVSVFTRFEKIEIVSAYYNATGGEGRVIVIAKNSGSSPAVIDAVFVNGAPCTSYAPTTAVSLTIGATTTITVTGCFQTGGVTNEIALHSTSGKTYPVAVLVP